MDDIEDGQEGHLAEDIEGKSNLTTDEVCKEIRNKLFELHTKGVHPDFRIPTYTFDETNPGNPAYKMRGQWSEDHLTIQTSNGYTVGEAR